MTSSTDPKMAAAQKTAGTPTPPKRFRIEKLEERIAPKRGGKGTHNCPTANCTY